MKVALVEPYVSNDSLKSYAAKTEPSHLLGMYNLLERAGCDVLLLDAYSQRLTAAALVEWVEEEAVTHIGFSIYDYSPCLTYVQKVFSLLPKNICKIVGGPGPTYCTDRMIRFLKPDWLVKGAGEYAMVELFMSGFTQEGVKCNISAAGETLVVEGSSMALDEIPFVRPYDMGMYDFQASLRIQSGCIGHCVFCSGAYQKKFDYISADNAEYLLDYLVNNKKADVIASNGPDFLSVPYKANELIRVLVENRYPIKEFRPGVRLDTLSHAIDLSPEEWKKLTVLYKISMESSIESFSINRLKRLGKGYSPDFLGSIFVHLRKIIKTCECTIVLGRIAIDPTITIDEFIMDCDGFRRLLTEFNDHVTVGGMLMNQFVPLFGTPASELEESDNPWLGQLLIDPAMLLLQENLLGNERFRLWCRLAEETSGFRERNMVFGEILRVAGERAREIRFSCPS